MCYSVDNERCLLNQTLTSYSDLRGCFWNPKYEQFTCLVSHDGYTFGICKDSCPKACSKNLWKCNGKCIPVNQSCSGMCMPVFTYICNGTCTPVNAPCNSYCYYSNEINCNGQCLDPKKEKEIIIKNRCEGEIQSSLKFCLIELQKPSRNILLIA
jgi:hypothetical protein